ncbi:hypothetical protein DFH28DRAFT_1081355 [Melampsora americana]|nr:hypothetical protein DFH28DRAFT_1081355 [Melampsora americana]
MAPPRKNTTRSTCSNPARQSPPPSTDLPAAKRSQRLTPCTRSSQADRASTTAGSIHLPTQSASQQAPSGIDCVDNQDLELSEITLENYHQVKSHWPLGRIQNQLNKQKSTNHQLSAAVIAEGQAVLQNLEHTLHMIAMISNVSVNKLKCSFFALKANKVSNYLAVTITNDVFGDSSILILEKLVDLKKVARDRELNTPAASSQREERQSLQCLKKIAQQAQFQRVFPLFCQHSSTFELIQEVLAAAKNLTVAQTQKPKNQSDINKHTLRLKFDKLRLLLVRLVSNLLNAIKDRQIPIFVEQPTDSTLSVADFNKGFTAMDTKAQHNWLGNIDNGRFKLNKAQPAGGTTESNTQPAGGTTRLVQYHSASCRFNSEYVWDYMRPCLRLTMSK